MSQTPQEQAASPMPSPESLKFAEYQTQAEQIKEQIKSLPTEQYVTGYHTQVTETAPPNAQNMAKYRMIRTETVVPDYATRLTSESIPIQQDLQAKLDALNAQASAEAASSPEFNQLLYRYNNPPATYEDVRNIALHTWGASIDNSTGSDRLRFNNLVSIWKSNPDYTVNDLKGMASGIQGYSSPTNAVGYNLQTKSVTVGSGSGGSFVVSQSAAQDTMAKQQAAKESGYTPDAKITSLVSENFKTVDNGILSGNITAMPSADILSTLKGPVTPQTQRASILENQPPSIYANPNFVTPENQAKLDSLKSIASTQQSYTITFNDQQITANSKQQAQAYMDTFALENKVAQLHNSQVRQQNIKSLEDLKSSINEYRKEGVKEIAISLNGNTRTVPIEFAYKNILESPQGSTYSPVKPINVPSGFTVTGSLENIQFYPEQQQKVGPARPEPQKGFAEGFAAPFYNIGATVYETGNAIVKEIQQPGSGLEFRGAGLPTDGQVRNPLNLPYVKNEVEKMPTATGELFSGKIPTLDAYNFGTIAGEVALNVSPAKILSKVRGLKATETAPEQIGKVSENPIKPQEYAPVWDNPALNIPKTRANEIGTYKVQSDQLIGKTVNPLGDIFARAAEPAVKESGLVTGKVPRIANTDNLDAAQRIADLEKARLTGQTKPVEENPFYNPASNVPKTRANEIGTYKVQSDQLIGKTVNPLGDIFARAAEPAVKESSIVRPTANQIAEAQIFKAKNPLLFTKKPEGTSPPSGGGGGGGGWKTTNVNLGKGIGISVKKDGSGGGISSSSRPSSPSSPPPNEKIINTKGGALIVKTKQEAKANYVKLGEGQVIIVKKTQSKPLIATIQNQKTKPIQKTSQLIQIQKSKQVQILKPAQVQKLKQPQVQKQPEAYKFKQPQAYKFKQPQALKQPEAYKFKQPEAYKFKQPEAYKFKQPEVLKFTQPQVPKTIPKQIKKKKEITKKPKYLITIPKKPNRKESKSFFGAKADFLGNTHVAQITGFASQNDITYGRTKTSKLVDKDLRKTIKKFRL